jgi:hypothetical protein
MVILMQCGMLVRLAERIGSLCRINYFALFISVLSTMTTGPSVCQDKTPRQTFNYPDRSEEHTTELKTQDTISNSFF